MDFEAVREGEVDGVEFDVAAELALEPLDDFGAGDGLCVAADGEPSDWESDEQEDEEREQRDAETWRDERFGVHVVARCDAGFA